MSILKTVELHAIDGFGTKKVMKCKRAGIAYGNYNRMEVGEVVEGVLADKGGLYFNACFIVNGLQYDTLCFEEASPYEQVLFYNKQRRQNENRNAS